MCQIRQADEASVLHRPEFTGELNMEPTDFYNRSKRNLAAFTSFFCADLIWWRRARGGDKDTWFYLGKRHPSGGAVRCCPLSPLPIHFSNKLSTRFYTETTANNYRLLFPDNMCRAFIALLPPLASPSYWCSGGNRTYEVGRRFRICGPACHDANPLQRST